MFKPPKKKSCVDIRLSSLWHCMRTLTNHIRANANLKKIIAECKCESHHKQNSPSWTTILYGTVERLIDSTCCPKITHEPLKYGVGSSLVVPRLIPWRCVHGTCSECGVNKKLCVEKCEVYISLSKI